MKNTSIQFDIALDNNNVPEKIQWDANDKPGGGLTETKSISVSVWDHEQKNTLRIDLWTKDMPVDDMKRFYIESIGGMAQSVLRATGDEFMAREMDALCDKLVEYLRRNASAG
jgi:gliding motility-associated protein GldC